MVESQPSKLLVAGPIPVSRSRFSMVYEISGFRWIPIRLSLNQILQFLHSFSLLFGG
jgi:hypothetical protein